MMKSQIYGVTFVVADFPTFPKNTKTQKDPLSNLVKLLKRKTLKPSCKMKILLFFLLKNMFFSTFF